MSSALSLLDRPEILSFTFYPRKDPEREPRVPNAINYFVPVAEDVSLGCRLYTSREDSPNILFFHGNGETVGDYDFIAPLYTQRGVNLFVADYRGYGLSGGEPTFTNMVRDCHRVFETFRKILPEKGYVGASFVMGRSLGSISAIELAYSYPGQIKGLIIESGFADPFKLMAYFGLSLGLPSESEFSSKVREISLPTLIIHAERDTLIPLKEARNLFESIPSPEKRLVIIPNADHNDLMYVGAEQYFKAIEEFVFTIR